MAKGFGLGGNVVGAIAKPESLSGVSRAKDEDGSRTRALPKERWTPLPPSRPCLTRSSSRGRGRSSSMT